MNKINNYLKVLETTLLIRFIINSLELETKKAILKLLIKRKILFITFEINKLNLFILFLFFLVLSGISLYFTN